MFNSVKRPFYASTQILPLPMLDKSNYHGFIARHMKNASIIIKSDDIDFILDWCRLHTFYVQTLCNRIFTNKSSGVTRATINEQIEMILKELETQYFTYRELLTGPPWSLLWAIAGEDMVFAPTAGEFIRKYELGTPAAVKRSLDSLLKKEMIFRQFDNKNRGYFQVYDVFLSRWLEIQH